MTLVRGRILLAVGVIAAGSVTAALLAFRSHPSTPRPAPRASAAASAPAAAGASCKPAAVHPFPVVLVHGTFESSVMWTEFMPVLATDGFCAFAINYDSRQDIAVSARDLSSFVGHVLATTGAPKVDIIGHSQGGMMPRYYMKYLGGAAKVDKLIAFAPSNYGTALAGIGNTPNCTSCAQQAQGSAFLKALNSPADTQTGVSYTVIETSKDEIVTPFSNAFLKGVGVTNILVQNVCPQDASGHVALATSDQNAEQLAIHALDPRLDRTIHCVAAANPT